MVLNVGIKVALVALPLVFWGCDDDRANQSQDSAETRSQALSSRLDFNIADGAFVQSIHQQSFIEGTLRDAPENADPARIFDAVLVSEGKRTPILDGVEDAKFLGDGSVIAISNQHELIRWTPTSQTKVMENVFGPLSVAGQKVVFTVGESMPDFRVVALDLESGQQWDAPRNMSPAWSPVIDHDGKRVLFTTSYRSESTIVLGNLGNEFQVESEFEVDLPPSGVNAPILKSDALITQTEMGLKRLHLPTKTWTDLSGDLPLQSTDGRIWVHDGGLREIKEGK